VRITPLFRLAQVEAGELFVERPGELEPDLRLTGPQRPGYRQRGLLPRIVEHDPCGKSCAALADLGLRDLEI
jgi:hypothetical protein